MRVHTIIYTIHIQTYYMQEKLRRSQINSINANKLNTLRCWGWLADACVCCSPRSNIFSTRWYVASSSLYIFATSTRRAFGITNPHLRHIIIVIPGGYATKARYLEYAYIHTYTIYTYILLYTYYVYIK